MELISQTASFGGWVKRFSHASTSLNCQMSLGIYLPPQAEFYPVPVLYWLSGLTCTDENFMQKAGAQRIAAQLGIAIVCPDTSSRGTDFDGEHDNYDFGSGAGFYLNATQTPWNKHYNMYDYVVDELPTLIKQHFPVTDAKSISGHSMGGHGALTIALKNPESYASVSAFSPICNPINSPWGQNAFKRYLGENQQNWLQYDASELVRIAEQKPPLFIDQGEADEFLTEQLMPDALQVACEETGHPLTLRTHPHYDHSYYFIASFIEEHLQYHATNLKKTVIAL